MMTVQEKINNVEELLKEVKKEINQNKLATPEEICIAEYGSLKYEDLKGKPVTVHCTTKEEWENVTKICGYIRPIDDLCVFHCGSNLGILLNGNCYCKVTSNPLGYLIISARSFIKANPQKKYIFTTYDGVKIYKGDSYYYIYISDSKRPTIFCNSYCSDFPGSGEDKDKIYFSNQKKAEEYTELKNTVLNFTSTKGETIYLEGDFACFQGSKVYITSLYEFIESYKNFIKKQC